MKKSWVHKVFKAILWTVIGLVALVLLIPVLLYVPVVQDAVKDIAVKEASKATGMKIAIDRLRLRWPLRLSVDGVEVIEAGGDTMLLADRLDVGVSLLPLFKGDIDVNYARLDSAAYQLGNADSLMWLRARIDRFELEASSLKMNLEKIDLSHATLDGADIRLVLRPDTTVSPVDTTASNPMVIRARDIELKRVRYSMSMLPTIDTLGVDVPYARLRDGIVDLGRRRINANYLGIDSVEAVYLTPAGIVAEAPPDTALTAVADTATWAITADSLRLTGRRAVYGVKGARPLPGLDMNMLEVSDIDIAVDDFYNRGTSIRVPLRNLSVTERCGLHLNADGVFAMNDSVMTADNFNIMTNTSSLRLDGSMATGDMTTDPSLPFSLIADGRLGLSDVALAMPSMRPMIAKMPAPAMIDLDVALNGTPAAINVDRLKIVYPGMLNLAANGRVDNPFDPDRLAGKVTLDGTLRGGKRLKRSLVAARLGSGFDLPERMSVKGTVDYRPQLISGDVKVTANNGRLAAKGHWNGRSEGYDATLTAVDFPVDAFMPAFGVGNLSATVTAKGRGYNPLSRRTEMDIVADVTKVEYQKEEYRDITLDATMKAGHAEGALSSGNPYADLDLDFIADVTDTGYVWDLAADVRHLNLQAMKITPELNAGSVKLASRGSYNPRNGALRGDLELDQVNWLMGTSHLVADKTLATVALDSASINASLKNGDLTAVVSASCPLDTLLPRIDAAMALINRQIAARNVDVDSLQHVLPPIVLNVDMGPQNIVSEYLSDAGTTFNRLGLHAATSPLINFNASLTGLQTGSTTLDSIRVTGVQRNSYLIYNVDLNNRPGTFDEFAHVELNGFLGKDRVAAMVRQHNIAGEEGYHIGLSAIMADSVATLRFVPTKPTIAYRQWTINNDNFVSYNFITHSFDADLTISDRSSSLRLYTTDCIHGESHAHHDTDSLSTAPAEDIMLQLKDIHLEDWLAISPYAPPVKGDVSADLRFHWDRHDLTGKGSINLDDLFYDRERVGSFALDADVSNDPKTGVVNADLALMVDSIRTITVKGVLNDSTRPEPFYLDFSMVHMPLRVVNPFLPKGTASLRGMLNGRMEITGNIAKPIFNGYLDFDTTAVKVAMLATEYTFDERKIPVDSNVVTFNDFVINTCNENPVRVNGTVDLRNLANAAIDLKLTGNNSMIVNSRRAVRGASVYGKAFVNLDAAVKGNMKFMRVDADASILAGTNVTYVLDMNSNTISTGAVGDMVRFVSFNDTTQVAQADSITPTMVMLLNAGLTVDGGTTINVDLSADGKNKVQLQGEGNFDFSMSPIDSNGRLIGRYTINKGFVRYTPPMMSEKLFDFDPESYVAFTGNIMNPQLNIRAVDHVKANVTQQGQNSRLVTFDVALSVTNTLENMNVAFDMSTDDDITVQNELQSMSPEQRANQAMNLLIYNVYTGPGTSASSNLSGNPLYSFLEGQLNSWMANNIKGVDISFGIEEYNRTYEGNTSTAMNYSYRVTKTLFNDRFKIVVGGNYTADANADENFAENLLSDVSFEYLLNKSGSMYIRLFRHTGYESILEGEVTQTGVGFVIKRRLNRVGDLFNFGRRRDKEAIKPETETKLPADEKE